MIITGSATQKMTSDVYKVVIFFPRYNYVQKYSYRHRLAVKKGIDMCAFNKP